MANKLTGPNSAQKADFDRHVRERNTAAIQALMLVTYPRVLWAKALSSLSVEDRNWVERDALLRR